MKVKELIEYLKSCDQEKIVVVRGHTPFHNCYAEVEEYEINDRVARKENGILFKDHSRYGEVEETVEVLVIG